MQTYKPTPKQQRLIQLHHLIYYGLINCLTVSKNCALVKPEIKNKIQNTKYL